MAEYVNNVDENGNPRGGVVIDRGLTVVWQNGPLSVDGERVEPNGAFVEDVLKAALQRLEHYNATKFHCAENQAAINYIELALEALNDRTRRRTAAGTEGTWDGN